MHYILFGRLIFLKVISVILLFFQMYLFIFLFSFFTEPFGIDSSTSYVLSQAAECALEIIRVCSNYKVDTGSSNLLSSMLSPSRFQLSNFRQATQTGFVPEHPFAGKLPSAYLNVHCGLSVGTMAGIDVGFDNRWEYFVIGDPLREVAQAEEYAAKGQVAMSSNAHAILHPDDSIYPCSCQFIESGTCWILSRTTENQTSKISLLGKTSLALDVSGQNEEQDAHQVREGLFQDLRIAADIVSMKDSLPNPTVNLSGTNVSTIFQKRLTDKLLDHTHEVLRINLLSSAQPHKVKTPTSITRNLKDSPLPTM